MISVASGFFSISACLGVGPIVFAGHLRVTTVDPPNDHQGGSAITSGRSLDRESLICEVLDRNLDLAAAEAAVAAARAHADSPMAAGPTRLSWSFAPASLGSAVPFGMNVELEQSVRVGQRRVERRMASTEAKSSEHQREGLRNELARAAATLFDDHFEIARALQTNAEHRSLLRVWLEVATQRYATGLGSVQDPLQAELELLRIEQDAIELEAARKIVTARINRLLHRAIDTPVPPPPDRLETSASVGSNDETALSEHAHATRPELHEADADMDARGQAIVAAQRRFVPELSAMASYNSMWADPQHRFMVGVGIMVPLQIDALRAGVETARAEQRRARDVAEARRDQVSVEVHEALARSQAAKQVLDLQRDRLIPTARERVEAARIGYENYIHDIDTLIDAERELRTVELAARRSEAELDRRRAELEWAVGRRPCKTGEMRR